MQNIAFSVGVLLILTSIAPNAQAQSIDIPFSGTVSNSCSFSTPTPGTLIQSPNYAAIESNGISQGKGVQVSVNCGSGGKLTIDTPKAIQVPSNFNASTLQSIVKRGNGSTAEDIASASSGGTFAAVSTIATPTMILPAGNSDLNVGMIAGKTIPGLIPNGDYRYTVKVTIAPN